MSLSSREKSIFCQSFNAYGKNLIRIMLPKINQKYWTLADIFTKSLEILNFAVFHLQNESILQVIALQKWVYSLKYQKKERINEERKKKGINETQSHTINKIDNIILCWIRMILSRNILKENWSCKVPQSQKVTENWKNFNVGTLM